MIQMPGPSGMSPMQQSPARPNPPRPKGKGAGRLGGLLIAIVFVVLFVASMLFIGDLMSHPDETREIAMSGTDKFGDAVILVFSKIGEGIMFFGGLARDILVAFFNKVFNTRLPGSRY